MWRKTWSFSLILHLNVWYTNFACAVKIVWITSRAFPWLNWFYNYISNNSKTKAASRIIPEYRWKCVILILHFVKLTAQKEKFCFLEKAINFFLRILHFLNDPISTLSSGEKWVIQINKFLRNEQKKRRK